MSLLEKLNEFSLMEANWNENGADPFSAELILKCKQLSVLLENCGFDVFPTGRNSIQFEKEVDGEYIEIEVFNDRIETYHESSK